MPEARLTAVVARTGGRDDITLDSLQADWRGWGLISVGPVGTDEVAEHFDRGWRTVADRSDAILFLHAGEEVLPGFAERLTPLFNPHVGAVYPDHRIGRRRVFCEPCGANRFEHPWEPRAALISVDALRRLDGFDLRLGPAAALDFWLRLTEQFAALHVPECLAVVAAQPTPTKEVWAQALASAQERARV